ncbi:MAG: hypothetical protein NTV44_02530 [Firmicutes bacterium]|nr:hypothetical protein [Bacillota bacterium]
MNKRLFPMMMLAMLSMTVIGCTPGTSSSSSIASSSSPDASSSSSSSSQAVTLTSITISGADDIEVDFDAEFNVLTGVTHRDRQFRHCPKVALRYRQVPRDP